MDPVKAFIQLAYKSQAWFDANATLILLPGQTVYLEEPDTNTPTAPQFKRGDGVNELQDLIFNSSGGSGVQSVTGTPVDNTDPSNPVINAPTQASFDALNSYVVDTLAGQVANKQPLAENLTEIAAINFLVGGGEWIYNEGGALVKKTTAQSKNLLNKDINIVKSNINQSHTGNTTETLLPFFVEIDPAVITIGPNTRFYVEITSSTGTSNSNAKSLEVYIGPTSGTLVGATKVAHHSNATIGAFACNYTRTIQLLNSLTSMKFTNLGLGSTGRDDIANTVAMATSNAQNFANKVYFMFTIILGNAADSRSLDGIKITVSNPDISL